MRPATLFILLLGVLGFFMTPHRSYAQCNNVNVSFTANQNNFCGPGPHTLNFTNTSGGSNAGSADYEWLLNGVTFDNTTGLTAPSGVTLNAVGTYVIELIASDSPPPCTESTTLTVVVHPSPTSNFSFTPNNACPGTLISFSNLSTGTTGSTTYSWNFGDGNTGNGTNPSHTYAFGGTYNVTLTVTNFPGCSSTFSQTVTVLDAPFVNIYGDDGDGNTINCLLPGDPTVSQTVQFFNNTTGAVSYFWDFGDGNTSTALQPSHTYNTYGTFQVVMTATGPNGCTSSQTIEVVFEKFVSASLTLNITEYSGCTPHALTTLQNLSNNANTYVWDFGDGTPPYTTNSITPPNHIYNTPGTYTISLTASNSCNTANATISPITIVGPPVAQFTPSILAGCAPQTVFFTNNSTGASPANAYQWNMGNGNTYNNTITPPPQTYSNAGNYTVSLTASNACGTSTVNQTIVLDTVPVADIEVMPFEQCSPAVFTFDNFSSANAQNYAWYLDGALYSTDSIIAPMNFSYPPGNSPVAHQIILVVSNNCGSDSDTVDILVHRPTLAQFAVSNTTLCLGDAITLTDQSLGENLSVEWDFGDGNSDNTSGPHTITYSTPGTYVIQLIANGYCGPDTVQQTITVNPVTVADFQALDPIEGCSPLTVSFQNTSTGTGLTYSWTVDGAFATNSTDLGPITFTETPGNTPVNHTIELTVTSACGTQTTQTVVTVHRPTQANMDVLPIEVCLGEVITATDLSLGENLSYAWDFGDGSSSTNQGPHALTYGATGTYTIQLITNGYCGPDTIENQVTVHPYPVADFAPDLPDGCAVFETTFTNNSTVSANHNWNFGVNATPATSVNTNPGIVAFPQPGTEMITLEVEENGCISRDTAYVEIYPLPNVDFIVDPSEGCSPLEADIINNSTNTGVENFEWDLGNGNTFTGYSPPVQNYVAILNDTVVDIQLTVTSGTGCADSLTLTATVHPIPLADFDLISDSICLNEPLALTNNSTPGMSYAWNLGDGNTSTVFVPTHTYSAPGTYTLTLIVNSAFNCSDTISKDIEVMPIPDAQFTNTTECLGYETAFTDNSTGNVIGWLWDFGDGTGDNQQNPTHEYLSAGSFQATLTVENNFNCTNSITQTVDVNQIPVADFTTSDFCLGDATQFSNLTTGNTVQFEWDFGDGSPVSNSTNPVHIYANTGSYAVQLVSFGGSGCSDTITQNITITGVPAADYSFITACTNDTTFFTDLSGGNPDTFSWDFGDGTLDNSNNPNPSHIYIQPGSYQVTLTAGYSASGCTNSITYSVDAHPRTVPQFTANTPCLGSETQFIDQTVNNPIIWQWDFGDGSPVVNLQNPAYEYAAPGIYNVTLITENVFGCPDTLLQSVDVFELPIPGFDFDTVCLNAATQFTDISQNAVSWEYFFGDGNSSNVQSPNHVYAVDGTFNVTQIVTNGVGCTDTLSRNVIVRPNPQALWTADTACYSYLTSFTDNSIDAVSWQWDLGDMANSSLANPQHTYSSDGLFPVELVVENTFGCTDTLSEPILVHPQPEALFTNSTVCAGNQVSFTDISLGNPVSFFWDFDDGSPGVTTQNPSHTFNTGGLYGITFIVENNVGCSDTLVDTIEVYTVPEVNFVADTVCLFSVTNFTDLTQDATPIASWDWNFGDGNTSFQQHPTYIYQNPGVFNVSLTVTNTNGCDSTFMQDVLVSEVPDADFSFTNDCFGAPTIFTDQSVNNPGIWLWDFGDGTIVNGGPLEQHTYSAPGNYVVSLTVLGSDSICSDQSIQVVTITQQANADFFIPNPVCAGEVFSFTDNSSTNLGTIDAYQWDMGDGTVYNTQNGSHVYLTDGIYTITLTVTTTDGCQSTHSESIQVLPLTAANFDHTLACSGQSIQFTNTSAGNTNSWLWDFGDGNFSTDQFPVHTYSSSGSYTVMLVVQNLGGCSDTIIQTVEVYDSPTANFSNDMVCYGDPTTFTDLSIPVGQISSWQWDFGQNEGSSILQNPQYIFQNYSEVHTVELIVTSNDGCTDTLENDVFIHPIVNFNVSLEEMSGCAPLEVIFENLSNTSGAADIITYQWDFGDGSTAFTESPVHLYTEPGNYPVTVSMVTSTDCQFVFDDQVVIDVFPVPVAGFAVYPPITTITDPMIEINSEAIGATDWEYYLGDGNYQNSADFIHAYQEPGNYTVMQIVQNEFGCIDTAYRGIEIQSDLIFYVPNAFTPEDDGRNDLFRWVVDGYASFSFRIFNRWGEEIFNTNDPFDSWDGKYMGQVVQDGVYVWQAKILDLKDEEHLITGHVTVLR
ncbi:MAG: PKD domain-containing protein [Brumimicrobium sp.]|nr:PKD domain-containing protein [Brumimicrobium sp.]